MRILYMEFLAQRKDRIQKKREQKKRIQKKREQKRDKRKKELKVQMREDQCDV